MSIKSYLDDTGTPLFKVSIHLRSRRNRKIRFTKTVKGIKTYKSAQETLRQIRRYAENVVIEKELHGSRLRVLISRWKTHIKHTRAETGEIGEKYLNDAAGTLQKWLTPYLNDLTYTLTSYKLQEVIRTMRASKISTSQIKKFRRWLLDLLKFGLHTEALPASFQIPTIEVRFNDMEYVPEILSHNEILNFMSRAFEVNHEWKDIWGIALLTGMRSGELYALEWSDIHFEKRFIRVSKAHKPHTNVIEGTKAKSWRDVPISDELMSVLIRLKNDRKDDSFVLPHPKPWKTGNQAAVIRRFCKENNFRSIKFHTLRACFATQLLSNGIEAAKVMKVCGWKDLSTMQRYIRLAGIEISGLTDRLSVYPELISNNVISLKQVT